MSRREALAQEAIGGEPGRADVGDRDDVARADLLRRAGRLQEASAAYVRAFELCRNERERTFLKRRLTEVSSSLSMEEP